MFLRYQQVTRIIKALAPETIVEIGTWQGDHALLMAGEALRHRKYVHYWGFDLFEDASDSTDANELNVRSHHKHAEIVDKLQAFQDANPTFSFDLLRGNTRHICLAVKPNADKRRCPAAALSRLPAQSGSPRMTVSNR